jgi:hypothetical protein
MASFPDLRPDRGSANAERRVARSFRRSATLLARSHAALCVARLLADSELATLHGAKALKGSAFPAKVVRSLEDALAFAGMPIAGTGPA